MVQHDFSETKADSHLENKRVESCQGGHANTGMLVAQHAKEAGQQLLIVGLQGIRRAGPHQPLDSYAACLQPQQPSGHAEAGV